MYSKYTFVSYCSHFKLDFVMKKIIIAMFLFAGTAFTTLQAQTPGTSTATSPAAPTLEWSKTEHDFKEIPQNVPAVATFEFKNNTKAPIVLASVVGSCGCTVPKWPTEPILPGKKSEISATYNAAAVGAFTKTVTVTIKGNPTPVILTIKGSVVEKK